MGNPTQATLRARHTDTPTPTRKPPPPLRHHHRAQQTPTTAYVCFALSVCFLIMEHTVLAYVYGDSQLRDWMYTGVLLLKDTLYAYSMDVYSALPANVLKCMYCMSWLLCVLTFKAL